MSSAYLQQHNLAYPHTLLCSRPQAPFGKCSKHVSQHQHGYTVLQQLPVGFGCLLLGRLSQIDAECVPNAFEQIDAAISWVIGSGA